MSQRKITLVGDGIENPWNAQTMIDAAGMFGSECLFRDREKSAENRKKTAPAGRTPKLITREALTDKYAPIIAFDNLEGAVDVYGFRLTGGWQPAVVVGNERRGIGKDIEAIADYSVQIPMFSHTLNCLNVAAAAAVALYYISRGGGAKLLVSAHPSKRRPELMMIGAGDHVELGSSIRSAGAFGWERVLVDDRAGVWFGSNRGMKAEGRAAARRQRNSIRLVPTKEDEHYAFDDVCVITTKRTGTPINRANLARGPRQLVAIPDESCIDLSAEDWSRLGDNSATAKAVQLLQFFTDALLPQCN